MRNWTIAALTACSLLLAGCSHSVEGTAVADSLNGESVISDLDYVGTMNEMCTSLLGMLNEFEKLEWETFDRSTQIRELYDWMVEGEEWKSLSEEERERTVRAFDAAESGRC